ncbi:MAG: hypothetical protein ACD_74C00227G0001, partial [uncultured bacterium]
MVFKLIDLLELGKEIVDAPDIIDIRHLGDQIGGGNHLRHDFQARLGKQGGEIRQAGVIGDGDYPDNRLHLLLRPLVLPQVFPGNFHAPLDMHQGEFAACPGLVALVLDIAGVMEKGGGHAKLKVSLPQGVRRLRLVPAGEHAGRGKADIKGVVEVVVGDSAGFVAWPVSGVESGDIIEQPTKP